MKMKNCIRDERQRQKKTLTSISFETEVPISALSRIERGAKCSQPTMEKIAAALKCDPRKLRADFDSLRSW